MGRKESFMIIGHRGSRGLEPENTIPAFLKAIRLGARGLEMDLYITKDLQVVVTHDSTISSDLCLTANGQPLDETSSKRLKIFSLPLKEIKPFDCGSEPNPDFPEQQNTEAHIPLLREVIEAIERMGTVGKSIQYFLELKSDPETDHINHPEPKVFIEQVVEVIHQKKITQQALVMSFDKRCLKELRKIAPEIKIGLPLLKKDEVDKEIQALSFSPDAIFPQFKEVDEQLVNTAEEKNIKVFPWTVNHTNEMEQLLPLRINGLITDYPDRAIELINKE